MLALSLRTTSEALLAEILDAWFAGEPSPEEDDRANVGHLAEIERLKLVRSLPRAGHGRASSPR